MVDISVGDDYLQESNSDDKLIDDDSKPLPKRRKRGKAQDSEARRESHKLIEQKRRQRINEKINELRELLSYPDGSQNKAVVLQAAVENIRYLKLACSKMMQNHRQLQEEHLQLFQEHERMRKLIEQQGIKLPDTLSSSQPTEQSLDKNDDLTKSTIKSSMIDSSNRFVNDLMINSNIPFAFLPDDTQSQIAMISPRGYNGSSNNMQSISLPVGLSVSSQSSFSNNLNSTAPFNETTQESASPVSTSNGNILVGPTTSSPLTSTETENGVSITRLLFSG